MTNWLAIINPRSNGGRTRALLPSILDRLQRVAEKTVITEYPGHAAELALNASAYGGLAVVGGDGTVFEILQGLNRAGQRIAVIPAGRGNSLARDLGLPHTLASIDTVRSRHSVTVDLMAVAFKASGGTEQERICASTVAVGYPTTVARLAGRKFAKFGRLCYAGAAAAVCPAPFRARIACNGQQHGARHLTGFVANNTRHMANFVAFPEASLEDGYFDVMELDAGFLKQSIHNISAFSRLHFYTPVTPIRTKTAEVLLDEPRELLLDGEIYPDVISVRIRILPAALTCNRADRKK
jgi:diacylglycerol kinase (ATP)